MSENKDEPGGWNPNPKSYCILCHCDVPYEGPDELAEHMLAAHGGMRGFGK